ncbi:MAG: bifunctional 4-hydroxy-2-oxoglutarate aldolase/2-dehydro-3-deoxy-phosphogluconate aldolase [Elusimicrobiaceae bacterium]|uniref:bifunctional 4-hydroxy-2-oxoglutarate aldolase/2-dehydro-3-deoxy-phosphogluconate aldolase n=1 Tax=Candidatus Proelusimicrobium excrementi TaxID=3416222 RepID=UPI003D0DAB45|nr:bifunctional 4-hydroxy-2-oxoglutarate aldolase/2-dehydro-3-deoxy-phosphogluconate aldolase [Elusimicrobiaceae bacterium]MBR3899117.1 bifunctional 4-hydroxy-2-oxoglutarate aldolase/2-dehydro-3-deoxy-phosphogluconate aldolase [Elusimicrobiaceae bacterium]
MNILNEISQIGIVPVIALDDAQKAVPLAKALIEGGLPCAEITFRTQAAEESIRLISQAYPEMLVGAGTILTPDQADKAVKAGAKFLVSPGLNENVVKHCQKIGVPIIAGVATPSEVEKALSLGLSTVKFFPAEAAGGLPMIKAMSAPYTQLRFMPTGGINAKNINSYLGFKKVIACGGSWMVTKELINNGNFAEITRLTKEAVATMLGFELRHIGINCTDEKESSAVASQFENLFGFTKEDRGGAYFAADFIEIMKKPFYGQKGHIAIATNFPQRAAYRLEKAGIQINWESSGYNPDGSLRVVYLKEEVGGFALHLLQK